MNKTCDLHAHSVFSDGTCTPAEIVKSADEAGLSAIALTDHNTVDGLFEFMSAPVETDIERVPGAEFSVDLDGRELHLLGLFIKPEYYGAVSELVAEVNRRKEESNIELIASLGRAGMVLDYEKIKSATPKGKINRAHIGAALTELGYTKSISHAFATVLSPKAGHYREPARLTVWQTIDFLKSIHALPVLAHPFLNLDEQGLINFLPDAKKRGLCGMECFYSQNDAETTEKSLDLAEEFGLLISGGSDFHGANKPDIKLGAGRGDLSIPYEYYLKLKEVADRFI